MRIAHFPTFEWKKTLVHSSHAFSRLLIKRLHGSGLVFLSRPRRAAARRTLWKLPDVLSKAGFCWPPVSRPVIGEVYLILEMAHTEAIIGGFGAIGLKEMCMSWGISLRCLVLRKRRLVIFYTFIDEFVYAELQRFIVCFWGDWKEFADVNVIWFARQVHFLLANSHGCIWWI